MGTTAQACRAAVLTSCSTSSRRICHGPEHPGGRLLLAEALHCPAIDAGRPSRQPGPSQSSSGLPGNRRGLRGLPGHGRGLRVLGLLNHRRDLRVWPAAHPASHTRHGPDWRRRSISSSGKKATPTAVNSAFRAMPAE